MSALASIRQLDYTVLFARDLPRMRRFYEDVVRVSPQDVDRCSAELHAAGVEPISPPQDQPWGHRTLFFRDPDGNVLEVYADI